MMSLQEWHDVKWLFTSKNVFETKKNLLTRGIWLVTTKNALTSMVCSLPLPHAQDTPAVEEQRAAEDAKNSGVAAALELMDGAAASPGHELVGDPTALKDPGKHFT